MDWSFEKKKRLELFTAIFRILSYIIFSKNGGFWEILEPITELYANRDGHSKVRVAFKELHSENNIQGITFKELQEVIFKEL